jgi:hypothetical protein
MKGKIEGRKKVMGRRDRRCKQLLDVKENRAYGKLKIGSTRSHFVGNSLWNKLWACRKTDYGLKEMNLAADR